MIRPAEAGHYRLKRTSRLNAEAAKETVFLRGLCVPMRVRYSDTLLRQTVQELRRAHQCDEELSELEPRFAEHGVRAAYGFAIRGRLDAAERVAKHLFDDAFLARAAVGQQPANLPRLGEGCVGK